MTFEISETVVHGSRSFDTTNCGVVWIVHTPQPHKWPLHALPWWGSSRLAAWGSAAGKMPSLALFKHMRGQKETAHQIRIQTHSHRIPQTRTRSSTTWHQLRHARTRTMGCPPLPWQQITKQSSSTRWCCIASRPWKKFHDTVTFSFVYIIII